MSGRAARKAQNRSLHVPEEVRRARDVRKNPIKRWKRTTSEDERKGLAEELLAAMSHEDAVRQPIEPGYESWEERRRREEPIVCMPLTMCAWPGRVPSPSSPSQSRAGVGLPHEALVPRDGYLGRTKTLWPFRRLARMMKSRRRGLALCLATWWKGLESEISRYG